MESVTVPLTQNQRDALTSPVFDIGGPVFPGSEVRRRLNRQDHAGAAQAFQMWRDREARCHPCWSPAASARLRCQALPPSEHARFFGTLRKWAPPQQNFLYVPVDAN
jgi:hypothetical protein